MPSYIGFLLWPRGIGISNMPDYLSGIDLPELQSGSDERELVAYICPLKYK